MNEQCKTKENTGHLVLDREGRRTAKRKKMVSGDEDSNLESDNEVCPNCCRIIALSQYVESH